MELLPLLGVISGQSMVRMILWLVVIGIIFGLLWWLIDYCGLPAPFNKVCKVVLAIFAVLILINALLGLVDHQIIAW